MRILALEDDAEDWMLLQAYLRNMNSTEFPHFDLERAASLAEAERSITAAAFDVLIADYHLPDGESLKFVSEQWRFHPHLYVLLVSSDEQLVTRPEVGELLRSRRVSFCVKSDLDLDRLRSELRASAMFSDRESGSAPLGHLKILQIDDDPAEREVLEWHCEKIRDVKLEVDWVSNSRDALQKISEETYDLILVDYRLGGELGTDVIDLLNAHGVHSNIVLCSGTSLFLSSKEALRCLGHQRASFISKSRLDESRLRQALRI